MLARGLLEDCSRIEPCPDVASIKQPSSFSRFFLIFFCSHTISISFLQPSLHPSSTPSSTPLQYPTNVIMPYSLFSRFRSNESNSTPANDSGPTTAKNIPQLPPLQLPSTSSLKSVRYIEATIISAFPYDPTAAPLSNTGLIVGDARTFRLGAKNNRSSPHFHASH